jgi:hypothetical protein
MPCGLNRASTYTFATTPLCQPLAQMAERFFNGRAVE